MFKARAIESLFNSEKDTESCSVEPLIDYPIKGMFYFKSHPSKIHKTLYLFSLGCGTLSLHTQWLTYTFYCIIFKSHCYICCYYNTSFTWLIAVHQFKESSLKIDFKDFCAGISALHACIKKNKLILSHSSNKWEKNAYFWIAMCYRITLVSSHSLDCQLSFDILLYIMFIVYIQ